MRQYNERLGNHRNWYNPIWHEQNRTETMSIDQQNDLKCTNNAFSTGGSKWSFEKCIPCNSLTSQIDASQTILEQLIEQFTSNGKRIETSA